MGRRRAGNDPSVRTDLSERQREVLALIADGATNGEIAERLGLSLEGAKWHVREIFARLGVDSREEAAEWWKDNRRPRLGPFAWSPVAVLGGAVSLAVVGFALVVGVTALGGDAESPAVGNAEKATPTTVPQPTASPTATQLPLRVTPVALKQQPQLREVAAGESWRVLMPDDGLGMPPIDEAVLAIGFDQQPPRVDVLDRDGRIAARIETGYQPMAQVNAYNETFVISDLVDEAGLPRSRILVLDLEAPRLLSDITLPGNRVGFTIFGFGTALSPDGKWAYWIEQAQQPTCPNGGDEIVCDLMIIHPVNLETMAAADLSAPMPRACGVPHLAPLSGSAVIVECNPREGSSWVIDAEGSEFMAPAPQDAPKASWAWRGGRVGNLVLAVSNDNGGALTSVALLDPLTSTALARTALTDTWGAFLLNSREVLFLRSNGRLERVDMLAGAGVQLPYAIEPGNQGSDIILTR